ncbi:RNA polymerase sigma factor [Streptomyces sp. NPDC059783]|uniref:RNA polymerase sigma factor n=1 Tax=Streptomyces sp. NPDC059783 TaxID=3346944 RepID=UPI003646F4B7
MYEGTAAGQSINSTATDVDLGQIFATYSDSLTRWVYTRLGRADWHLAEDIASETFLRLVRDYTGRRIEFPLGLLRTIAGHAISDHYRLRRSGEAPADFSDRVEEARLPESASAEDTALAGITVLTMLAEIPALGVAA